jgi:hypothetical protein
MKTHGSIMITIQALKYKHKLLEQSTGTTETCGCTKTNRCHANIFRIPSFFRLGICFIDATALVVPNVPLAITAYDADLRDLLDDVPVLATLQAAPK